MKKYTVHDIDFTFIAHGDKTIILYKIDGDDVVAILESEEYANTTVISTILAYEINSEDYVLNNDLLRELTIMR